MFFRCSQGFALSDLIFPKSFEPARRQRGVPRGILDIAVAQISLQRARIDAVIGQLIPARMTECGTARCFPQRFCNAESGVFGREGDDMKIIDKLGKTDGATLS